MRGAATYLQSFCRDNPDMTGYILGAVSTLDPLRGEEETVTAGENRWFCGVTEDELRRLYTELIHTTPADLLALVPALEELAAETAVCVTAGKPLLEACELDEIVAV